MKVISLFLLGCLFSSLILAQIPEYLSYNSTYGSVNHMIVTSDGGKALMLHGMDANPIIVKTDEAGFIQWQRKVILSGASVMTQICETQDQGIVYLTNDNSGGIILGKLSSAGTHRWTKRYSYSVSNQGFAVTGNGSNGALIVGNGCAGHNFAIYTDSLGVIVWSKQYVNSSDYASTGTDVIKVSETDYVIAGYSVGSTTQSCQLFSINDSGSVNWYKEYVYSEGRNTRRMIRTADGGYSVVLNSGALPATSILLHTDSVGNPVWQQVYECAGDVLFNDLIELQDGSTILAGYVHYTSLLDNQACLMRVTATGTPVWAITDGNMVYAGNGADAATEVVSGSGDSYTAGGYADGMVLWHMTDSTGFCNPALETMTAVTPACTALSPAIPPSNITFVTSGAFPTVIESTLARTVLCTSPLHASAPEVESSLVLYPNPATDRFTVTLPDGHVENLSVSVFNSEGKEVMGSFKMLSGESISVGSLPVGVYQVRINTADMQLIRKLVVM